MIGLHVYKSHLSTISDESNNKDKSNKSIVKLIKKEIKYANKFNININCFQIFIKNPHGYDKLVTSKELLELRDYNVFVHSSYVSTMKNTKGIAQIKSQLKMCDIMDSNGLIVHLPKLTIDEIVESIKLIKPDDFNTKIYLENKVIKHNESKCGSIFDIGDESDIEEKTDISIFDSCDEYNTPKQINKLYKNILKSGFNNVGICIDTAHLWVSGVDITTKNDMKKYLNALCKNKHLLEKNNLLFHINDSHNNIASYVDHHDYFGSKIWKHYKDNNDWKESGIYYLIRFCIKNKISMLMESREHNIDQEYIFLHMFPELRT